VPTGFVTPEAFTNSKEIYGSSEKPEDMISLFEKMMNEDGTATQAYAVANGYDFAKAISSVSIITKGELERRVVLSFHDGFLNIGAWSGISGIAPGEEHGVYYEVAPGAQIEGAAMLDKNAIDQLKTRGKITIELVTQLGTQIFRYRTAEMDAVVMPIKMEEDGIFAQVFGYEYETPKATGIYEEKPLPKMIVVGTKPTIAPKEKKAVAPVEPGEKIKKLKLYGDVNGRWLSVPKTIISRYNLWDQVKDSALETQTLICPVWGPDADVFIEALQADGFKVEIDDTNIVAGKSSLSRLPHYQKAG
jgi:hypothetical protein